MRKKICHITSAHNRYDIRIFHKECVYLARLGYDVTLLVNDGLEDEVLKDVKIKSTRFIPNNRLQRIYKSYSKIKKKISEIDADIYHLHDPDLLLLVGYIKSLSKKVIFDSHENYSMQIKERRYIPDIFKGLISRCYKTFEKKVFKKVDHVIFPCMVDGKNPFADSAKKVTFVDNTPIIDTELYNSKRKDVDTPIICYLGSLSHYRGITNIVKASYNKNVKLVLAGRFESSEYRNELENLKEFDIVEYKGLIGRQEVREVYQNSTIGICTILNQGQYAHIDNLPTKVYEYMSMGLPVIVSKFDYVQKVLEEYKFGIAVDPEDCNQIESAIDYLINNPKVAQEMGLEGKRAIKERFNWSNEEKKLALVYEDVSKNRICHVTSAHIRYDVRIFHKECMSLVKNGYEVTLLVNDDMEDETVGGVKIVSTNLLPKNRYQRMVKSHRLLKQYIDKIDADVYHFHDPDLLMIANRAKNRDKKVIFDFHEFVYQQILYKNWIPRFLRNFVSFCYKNYEYSVAKKLDALITVSPNIAEYYKKINDNVTIITNYPIIKDFSENEHDKKDNRNICFAGGIRKQWNQNIIINAIDDLENIRFILAGNIDVDYLKKLKRLNGWEKVDYLGKIPHEQVKDIYNNSLVGMCLLSYDTQVGNEGTLGNTKLFEYMEAGLAVICSSNAIWKSIVEKYDCGIVVEPSDEDAIKSAISYLIENPQVAREMGAKGQKAVKEEFNWEIEKKKLVEIYKAL